ncbi:MAG: DNA polymerase I [Patescibacteria group bacterium]
MRKLVLIDSNALVHRAFHALPPTLNSATGVPTNAIFGFMAVMIRMIKDLKPDYIAATFDLPGATFRHEEFAEYKSHRIKAPDELYLQIPYIKEILTKFGIPIFEKAGFEADDLIGALAEEAKVIDDLQVVIMTGDLDTLQLVERDKVVVFTLRKGVTDTVTYDQKEVMARYGLKPSQLIDFKGLKGDPSDNIPGVPGIGDKTAAMLIQKFGSLEKLYESIAETKKSNLKSKKLKGAELSEKLIQKLIDNKDQAFFSKHLSTIIRDVDVDFDLEKADWREHLDKPALEKLLKDLALYNIVKRLGELDGNQPEPVSLFDVSAVPKVSVDGIKTTLLNSSSEVASCIEVKPLYIDINQGMVLFGFDTKQTYGFYETLLKEATLLARFGQILADPSVSKIGHDVKAISCWALEKGIKPTEFTFDTKLAAYLLNLEVKDYLLERLFFLEFGRDMDSEPLKRPAYVAMLRERYEPKLNEFKLTKVQDEIELPLSPVLARMERMGIKVDTKILGKLSIIISKEIEDLEKQIAELAGGEFNINSPKQLSVVLFEKLELKSKVRKTGKGALSTAHSELEKLAHEHPIIELILKYRELQKLKTTYIEPFPALLDSVGRVHTTYNQTGTTTGRLSSQDPNLQNIPIRTELGQEFRKAFIAEKDFVLLSCDYSQIDLRVAAHLSGDMAMSDAFKKGEDIHTRTAAAVFHISPDKVIPSMRRQAKTLNFGVLYGMGLLGFQRAAGVSRAEAKVFIDNYMKEFSGLAEYLEKVKQQARKDGYVSTLFGRRRPIPDILSTMPMLRAGAERMAINMPIQGTSADLIKIAMINIQKHLDENYGDGPSTDSTSSINSGQASSPQAGSGQAVRMLLQVHDELLFEVKRDMVEQVSKEIKKIMESAHHFNVPIVADIKSGDNWAEMSSI